MCREKRTLVLCFCLMFAACVKRSDETHLFVINLFHEPCDLSIGEPPGCVFEKYGIPVNGVTALEAIPEQGLLSVSAKPHSSEIWQRMPASLAEGECRLRPGMIAFFLINPRGIIRFIELEDDRRIGARLCFINATTAFLPLVKIYPEQQEELGVFWTANVKPFSATSFHSVVPGVYSLDVRSESEGIMPEKKGSGGIIFKNALICPDASYSIIIFSLDNNVPVVSQKLLAFRRSGKLSVQAER